MKYCLCAVGYYHIYFLSFNKNLDPEEAVNDNSLAFCHTMDDKKVTWFDTYENAKQFQSVFGQYGTIKVIEEKEKL